MAAGRSSASLLSDGFASFPAFRVCLVYGFLPSSPLDNRTDVNHVMIADWRGPFNLSTRVSWIDCVGWYCKWQPDFNSSKKRELFSLCVLVWFSDTATVKIGGIRQSIALVSVDYTTKGNSSGTFLLLVLCVVGMKYFVIGQQAVL